MSYQPKRRNRSLSEVESKTSEYAVKVKVNVNICESEREITITCGIAERYLLLYSLVFLSSGISQKRETID